MTTDSDYQQVTNKPSRKPVRSEDEERALRRERARLWRERNPDRYLAAQARYRSEHAEEIRARQHAGGKERYRRQVVAAGKDPEQIGKSRVRLTPEQRRENARLNQARWRAANPEKTRERGRQSYHRRKDQPSFGEYVLRERLRKFALTAEEFRTMLAAQNELCAICEKPETMTRNGRTIRLAVDHDHETGRIRGLLCKNCNTLVVHSAHHTELLSAAIAYLERTA